MVARLTKTLLVLVIFGQVQLSIAHWLRELCGHRCIFLLDCCTHETEKFQGFGIWTGLWVYIFWFHLPSCSVMTNFIEKNKNLKLELVYIFVFDTTSVVFDGKERF